MNPTAVITTINNTSNNATAKPENATNYCTIISQIYLPPILWDPSIPSSMSGWADGIENLSISEINTSTGSSRQGGKSRDPVWNYFNATEIPHDSCLSAQSKFCFKPWKCGKPSDLKGHLTLKCSLDNRERGNIGNNIDLHSYFDSDRIDAPKISRANQEMTDYVFRFNYIITRNSVLAIMLIYQMVYQTYQLNSKQRILEGSQTHWPLSLLKTVYMGNHIFKNLTLRLKRQNGS
nr:4523_t:CDS:2 [Entrophospora candida]CAG8504371.1 2186_t:CDS:2 [Entrophospora candida]